MANAFTLQGATPNNPMKIPSFLGGNIDYRSSLNKAGSPYGKALNTIATDPNAPKASVVPSGVSNSGGFTPSQQSQYEKTLAMFSNPSTPLKSITTAPDGTHTAVYHAPVKETTPTVPSDTTPKTPFGQVTSGLITTGQGGNNNPIVEESSRRLGGIVMNPNPAATAAGTGLQNIADKGTQAVNDANANLLKFQKDNPYMIAAQFNPNVAADVASGRAGLLGQTFGKEEQALATGVTNALNQQGQQITAGNEAGTLALTGQGQQITAATNAGSLGTTQQGQNIGALGTAGSLTQPSSNFPFVFDPTTKSFTAPGVAGGAGTTNSSFAPTFNPQTDATNYAKAVINHQISLADARSAMSYAGSSANNYLNSAIIAQGGNPTTLEAQAGVQGAQATQVEGYKSALQQGKNLQSQLNDLITQLGLNPSDLNLANIGIQKIAANVSSPGYKILSNYVNDIANTYSQILTPPGGSATDTTRGIAASMLDATAKGTTIMDVMRSLDSAAEAKIAGTQTIGTGNTSGSTGGLFSW